MAHNRSVGPMFSLAGGQSVSWSISYGSGFGLDAGIVTAAPNIVDDILGVVELITDNQGVGASNNGLFYTVEIRNPGTRSVTHNLNIEDWF